MRVSSWVDDRHVFGVNPEAITHPICSNISDAANKCMTLFVVKQSRCSKYGERNLPLKQRRHIASVSVPILTRRSIWLGSCSSRFFPIRFDTCPLPKGACILPHRAATSHSECKRPSHNSRFQMAGNLLAPPLLLPPLSHQPTVERSIQLSPQAAKSHSDCKRPSLYWRFQMARILFAPPL